jgi:hypothetical protein
VIAPDIGVVRVDDEAGTAWIRRCRCTGGEARDWTARPRRCRTPGFSLALRTSATWESQGCCPVDRTSGSRRRQFHPPGFHRLRTVAVETALAADPAQIPASGVTALGSCLGCGRQIARLAMDA